MSRMAERGESWLTHGRVFACEQCRRVKRGYRVAGRDGIGDSEPCAPPLGWTVKDSPARFFCSIECVDKYEAECLLRTGWSPE